MIRFSAVFFFAGMFFGGVAYSAGMPFYPQAVDTLQLGQTPDKGFTRLRVSISNGDSQLDSQVRIGMLSVCSASACYRPFTNGMVDLYNTSSGTSETLVDMEVPFVEIRTVHFESVAGLKSVTGDITLSAPFKLIEGYEGGEILVVVNKEPSRQTSLYHPTAVATGYLRSSVASVYYNPKTATSTFLKFNTALSIPAGATVSPQIFNVAIHDTGDEYPLVDIYPEIKFLRPASITFNNINRANVPNQPASASGVRKSRSLTGTGVIRSSMVDELSNTSVAINAPVTVVAAATDSCIADILTNAHIITNTLATTGTTYLSWCETKPPYVHIAVTDTMDSREFLRLAHDNVVGVGALLPLKRITTWAAGNQVVINGFTWDGDIGVFEGGRGYANGFVGDSNFVLGNNRIGGGTSTAAGAAGNKFAMLALPQQTYLGREGVNPPLWGSISPLYTEISSSTSIVKYGVCASDALVNRWSAIGTSPSQMIFMSSTSGSSTSATELCAVFKALGANNAIRLDGGPSTAMTIDGFHKNPLTGIESFTYGSARYIAYGLKMGYSGAGATPAPKVGRNTIPPNPCRINPIACQ